MKAFSILILAYLLCTFKATGQEFNKSINKDSLLKTIIKDMSESNKKEFLEAYNSGNEQSKEFLLFMYSMPKSSKKELTQNIDLNYEKINALKTQYTRLVPANYTVSIEFNPENKIVSTKETIDFKIITLKDKETTVTQEWNLEYNTPKLNSMLAMLKWTNETLTSIKKLLRAANCVSIENGQITTIGFARSGMGKYSYLLFDNNLTAAQVKQYNDGCSYIYYKNNIVLEYGGGAVGPQCFPN
ncbi:hypothetical protein [Mucilaginibacter flavidus]|uniref:hypothetical protein n=1 Tax=Mucilaginibacter flavidus TaxID=2949309 RepID=UPI002092B64C|nr:hypothetical protein [Mucilaginibacter flavidus]MCO5947887.1 hypothetical protein [Mucilaginibacter flavidus]